MKIMRWVTTIGLIATVVASLGFVKFSQIQAMIAMAESFPEPSAAVQTHTTSTETYRVKSKVTGQVVAPQMVTLTNEYQGKIVKVGFAPGQLVEEDQLLLVLDSSEEKSRLVAANARVALADKTVARLRDLRKQNRVSAESLDQAEAELAIAQSEVSSLEVIIAKKTIRAPFDGTVGLNQFHQGQFLAAYSEITTLVGRQSQMWIDFKLPQTAMPLNMGDSIDYVTIGGHPVQGSAKLIAKTQVLTASSRHIQYRAAFVNSAQLGHNTLVNLFVPKDQAFNVVMVPNSAVKRDHFGDYVFLLEKDDAGQYRAVPRQVKLGHREKDQQVVLSGLTGGEFIATEGSFKLREGLLVHPQMSGSGSSQAAAGGK